MILAVVLKNDEQAEDQSSLPVFVGIVLAIVAVCFAVALGYGIRGASDKASAMELGAYIIKRFLFFGGAMVCMMIGAVSAALTIGKSELIKSATGLEWPGFLAGLFAAQAIVFFQQCNMAGIFQLS